jgi:hypothetical protein
MVYHVLLIFFFQIFPADVCVDILIEELKSSRYVLDTLPSLIWSCIIVLCKKASQFFFCKPLVERWNKPVLNNVEHQEASHGDAIYFCVISTITVVWIVLCTTFNRFSSSMCAQLLTKSAICICREVISLPSLGWLIRQCQQQIIINILRRSLVNDANSSRWQYSPPASIVMIIF